VPTEGWLVAALLYAGPGAVLSHATAAWWWGLIDAQPPRIEVSTPTRVRSCPEVHVHHPHSIAPVRHRRLPVASVARTIADMAARSTLSALRQMLAEADSRKILDVEAIEAELGPARRGSARLRQALSRHQPRLALTRSALERLLFELCESAGLPLPEVNAEVGWMTVDALWRDQRVIVEVDGKDAHSTPAQIDRDRRRELRLRALGFTVLRYTHAQLDEQRALVIADLSRALGSRAA
jgi:hypothetical protein